MATILITGGSGRLGRALQIAAKDQNLIVNAPSHSEMDILDFDACERVIDSLNPGIIIHAAGFVDAVRAEKYRRDCLSANVQGTINVCRAARHRRIVYISTDYVFDGGDVGDYEEEDTPQPINWYGETKLIGEWVALSHEALVLRAPFRANPPWPYAKAFVDQWTSCDFVSVRAPQIIQAALMTVTGILHIGGQKRSVYELAQLASPNVGKCYRGDVDVALPRDTSLNSSKWNLLIEASARSFQPAENL